MEEPNGAKANVALGSNTPVSPGKPYLVQINPTAAEEIGPASYDITVVRKCTFFNSSGYHMQNYSHHRTNEQDSALFLQSGQKCFDVEIVF